MSRRSLSLQRRCAWWLNECLRLGWDKSQLPALEKLYWKYKPWNAKKMAKRGPGHGSRNRTNCGGART